MSNIESTQVRTNFFPRTEDAGSVKKLRQAVVNHNDPNRKDEIDQASKDDARVDISSAIKDFSKIKKAVDMAPTIDNSDKISSLKQQIANGTYQINEDAIADRMLEMEI
jgi:negative regulator of flagellin synthesis FlgM